MKDLQDFCDSLNDQELLMLGFLTDKEELSNDEAERLVIAMRTIYEAEMDMQVHFTDRLIADLYQHLKIGVAIAINVRKGHMKINSGRLSIKHNCSCQVALTDAGRIHVEQNLPKKAS
jgi:hypothetical protein